VGEGSQKEERIGWGWETKAKMGVGGVEDKIPVKNKTSGAARTGWVGLSRLMLWGPMEIRAIKRCFDQKF